MIVLWCFRIGRRMREVGKSVEGGPRYRILLSLSLSLSLTLVPTNTVQFAIVHRLPSSPYRDAWVKVEHSIIESLLHASIYI